MDGEKKEEHERQGLDLAYYCAAPCEVAGGLPFLLGAAVTLHCAISLLGAAVLGVEVTLL